MLSFLSGAFYGLFAYLVMRLLYKLYSTDDAKGARKIADGILVALVLVVAVMAIAPSTAVDWMPAVGFEVTVLLLMISPFLVRSVRRRTSAARQSKQGPS